MTTESKPSLAKVQVGRRALLCGIATLSLGFLPDAAEAATGITQGKDGKIHIDLKKNKGLAKVGGAVVLGLADGSSLALVRSAAGTNGLNALNLSCTHNGVTVMEQDKKWICPAHGSQFALNGKLVNGPARSALMKYPLKVTSSEAIIG